jgi:rRNA maturation endonuclease Nob1
VTGIAALFVVAGVALYVAAPLFGDSGDGRVKADLELDRLMHERSLAVQALRELEFDHQMGKLSQADYDALHAPLEARALTAMAAIEALRAQRRTAAHEPRRVRSTNLVEKTVERRLQRVAYCPECGVRARADGNFCVECGTSLGPLKTVAARAQ